METRYKKVFGEEQFEVMSEFEFEKVSMSCRFWVITGKPRFLCIYACLQQKLKLLQAKQISIVKHK